MATGTDPARRIRGGLLFIGLLILCAILVLVILHRQSDLPEERGLSSEEKNATLYLTGVHHTDIRNGETDWILDAKTAVMVRDANRAHLTDLQVTLYSKTSDTTYLSAASGTLDMDSNDLEVSGDVVLKNEQREMKTDTLTYNDNERVFVTKSPVIVRSPAVSQKASGMTYYRDSGRIKLSGNVEVIF